MPLGRDGSVVVTPVMEPASSRHDRGVILVWVKNLT